MDELHGKDTWVYGYTTHSPHNEWIADTHAFKPGTVKADVHIECHASAIPRRHRFCMNH